MRVAFVYRGAENLGIEYLSSYLTHRGHETRLFFDPASFSGDRVSSVALLARFAPDYRKLIAEAVAEWKPDLVAYSAYTASYRWMLDTARRVKALHPAPAVFGGVHVTAVPQRVIAQDVVDAIVVGEGEGALADLVESVEGRGFSRHDIPNAGFKIDGEIVMNPPRPLIKNLDSLPMPDKQIFYEKSSAFRYAYMAMTGRGCPYKCKYCCNSIYLSLYPKEELAVRQRSVANVIEELLPWRNKSRIVTFWDDVFPTDPDWQAEFVREYRRYIDMPFICFVHPSRFNERTAEFLKEAGCFNVKIGIQTISKAGGKILGRMSGADNVKRTAELLGSAGISFSMDHILGLPGETEDDLSEAASMYNQVRPIRINSHWLSYFPGTPLIEDARSEGKLSPEELEKIEEGIEQTTFMLPRDLEAIEAHLLILFDLIPLLPKKWIDYLIERNRWKKIPFNKFLHQTLLTLDSLKGRDYEVAGFIRYAFGPKNAP